MRTSSTLACCNRSRRAIATGKLRLRVTWWKSANLTFTVTFLPKAFAFSHQAQTSSAIALVPDSISSAEVRSLVLSRLAPDRRGWRHGVILRRLAAGWDDG